MSKANSPPRHLIFPARYFEASPTWQEWNKLTVADVHALSTESGFAGQNVYFHLNHPIRFVRLVGLLVEVDQMANGRYTLLTLDDGSGACITAKITRRDLAKGDDAEYPSNTTVDNVDAYVETGLPAVYLNSRPIHIGSIVKVKGTVSTFRGVRQIEVKRMFAPTDTNAEAQAWLETASWKRNVLSQPWILTTEQRHCIDDKIRGEEKAEHERLKKRREHTAKYDEKKRKHNEKREAKRLKQEAKLNIGALKGSHIIPAPWDPPLRLRMT